LNDMDKELKKLNLKQFKLHYKSQLLDRI
jgi:hypothetical protein